MVNSTFTLYKSTHLVAVGIFAMLMIMASAAIAVVRHSGPDWQEAANGAQYLGRFVVTPGGTHFDPDPARQPNRDGKDLKRDPS